MFGPLVCSPLRARRELWLMAAALSAAALGGAWGRVSMLEAVLRPLQFLLAASLGTFIAWFSADAPAAACRSAEKKLGTKPAAGCALALAGASGALLTAPVSCWLLWVWLGNLKLSAPSRGRLAVLGCLGISLGSSCSPFGSALSAAALSRLSNPPLSAGDGYLLHLLAPWALAGVLSLAAAGWLLAEDAPDAGKDWACPGPAEAWMLAARMSATIFASVVLGAAVGPALDGRLKEWPAGLLLGLGAAAMAGDGAVAAALFLDPMLSEEQFRAILTGLACADAATMLGKLPQETVGKAAGLAAGPWAGLGIPAACLLLAVLYASLKLTGGL